MASCFEPSVPGYSRHCRLTWCAFRAVPLNGTAWARRRRLLADLAEERGGPGVEGEEEVGGRTEEEEIPDNAFVRALLIAMQNTQLRAMAMYTRPLDARDVAGP